jgi:YVTN family beta-propeller protein
VVTSSNGRSKYLLLLVLGIVISSGVIIAWQFNGVMSALVGEKSNNVPNDITNQLNSTEISVGNKSLAIDFSPTSNRVFVADEAGFISIIDGFRDETLQKVPITGKPAGMAVSSTNKNDKIYVSTNNDDSEDQDSQSAAKIIVIDGSRNQISTVLNITGMAGAMDIDPNLGKLYVYVGNHSDPSNNHILIVDTKNDEMLPTNLRINETVNTIAINSNKSRVYVADDSGHITIFDSKKDSVVSRLSVAKSGSIDDMIVDPKTDKTYILAAAGKRLFVIDESNKVSYADGDYSELGSHLAINPNSNRVYSVTERADDNTISAIDTTTDTVINTAKILADDKRPTALTVNPSTNKLYIATEGPAVHFASGRPSIYYSPGTVVIIKDNNNEISTIHIPDSENVPGVKVGKEPNAVAVNQITNLVYVTNSGSDTVSVINGSTDRLLKNIPVDEFPRAIAINPVTNKIYVANRNSESITVIDGNTNSVNETIHDIGPIPSDIAIDSNKNLVYIASDIIHVIDGSSDTQLFEISGISPYAISFDHNDDNDIDRLYASVSLSNIVSMTDSLDEFMIGLINVTLFNGTANNTILLDNAMISNETLNEDISINDALTNGAIINGSLIEEDGSLYMNGTFISDSSHPSNPDGISEHFFLQGNLVNGTSNIFSDVSVGFDPRSIAFNKFNEKIYVANRGSGTVSVIDPHYVTGNQQAGTVVADTRVGRSPYDITVNSNTSSVYITNQYSNTISVIYGSNNTVAATIPTGNNPTGIDINPYTNLLYVANSDSNTVSIIDTINNRVIVPENITVNINPANSGHIICNKKEFPTKQLLRIPFESNCSAEPNSGFQFISWTKRLPGNSNSTSTISSSANSESPFNYFLSIFYKPNDEYSTLKVLKNGNYTANFGEIPQPLPPEYWASLFTVVATALIGSLLIPAVAGWFKSRMQTSRLNSYHQDMVSLYKDGLDEKDISELNRLNQKISNEYSKGKINNEQYTNLKKEISVLYEEIYKKEIDSSTSAPNFGVLMDKIKDEITDAYSKGKITELHYKLLNERISDMTSKEDSRNDS